MIYDKLPHFTRHLENNSFTVTVVFRWNYVGVHVNACCISFWCRAAGEWINDPMWSMITTSFSNLILHRWYETYNHRRKVLEEKGVLSAHRRQPGGTDMRSRARPHPVIADMWTLDPWQYEPLFTQHLLNCVWSFVINDIYKRVSETSRCSPAGEYKHVVLTGG